MTALPAHPLFEAILSARGLASSESRAAFLLPDYVRLRHDPYLFPDMSKAVERLIIAKNNTEKVVIYGDYDIDGLTATAVLMDGFKSFGLSVDAFIPNRFEDGYGLSMRAIELLALNGTKLIVTVDCGSLSHKEIARALELGMEVIVTDHHTVGDTLPQAVAVVNPKRHDNTYPFDDLSGVGVAFKLVQALQQKLPGLPEGQERWLLDLVALGTVCDVVSLRDENRANVFWGLKVLAKTRRPGLKALMAVAGVDVSAITARTLGFVLGPRLNASGRLETAKLSLELLTSTDNMRALAVAQQLDTMNLRRRAEQDKIYLMAVEQAEAKLSDPVLVVSHPEWSHGIVGIVAAKLLERYKKPAFVLQEMGDESKGSARSYGDFSAVEAIRFAEEHITKGGGHKLAAGVTLPTKNIPAFTKAVNDFYRIKQLQDQQRHLDPKEDAYCKELVLISEDLVIAIESCQPFGHGNPEPVLLIQDVKVSDKRHMGERKQHVKITVMDAGGKVLQLVAFSRAHEFDEVEVGDPVQVWAEVELNEWKGRRSVQGRLRKLIKVEQG